MLKLQGLEGNDLLASIRARLAEEGLEPHNLLYLREYKLTKQDYHLTSYITTDRSLQNRRYKLNMRQDKLNIINRPGQ